MWYERKIGELEARLIDFEAFSRMPPDALPACGDGMYLDWDGIPQLDISYALGMIAQIDGFQIAGMNQEELFAMAGTMAGGMPDMDMLLTVAQNIWIEPSMSLYDMNWREFDTT